MSASSLYHELENLGLTSLPADWPAPVERWTAADVERELARPPGFALSRLAVLVSPAASAFLESLAQRAAALTRQRFGNVINLYAPLYLSNYCRNRCRYCGFRAGPGRQRRWLTLAEAEMQARWLAAEGFRDLLLVAGDDPEHITLEYLAALAQRLQRPDARKPPSPLFASLAVEIQTFDEVGYRSLVAAGVDGVTLYQETYDKVTYAAWHPAGPKADYQQRLAASEAAAAAGMRRLGIGALLGLQDWRFEALALGAHAHFLMKRFWRTRVAISFPRLRPALGAEPAPCPVTDAALVQMILALRLCFPDVALVLSTREPAALRDRLLPLGITQLSAGSKT
ncbi:MAG: radical SAM protein, partial [Planctomycetota bacterium]|nr:radical SAM protein [Planctomycetota bacterium]